MSTNCQVCEAQAAKYKCPACSTQSCSLACTKLHKDLCPGPSESSYPPPETEPSSTTALAATDDRSKSQASDPPSHQRQHPLSTLISSPALSSLLSQSPSLHTSLQKIYTLTLEPSPNTPEHAKYVAHFTSNNKGRNRNHRGRGGRVQKRWNNDRPPPWTAERGFKLALAELRTGFLRKDMGGEEVRAMRDFAALVERCEGDRERGLGKV